MAHVSYFQSWYHSLFYLWSYVLQHATADVSLMLLGSKSDLEGRREVTHDDAEKVKPLHVLLFMLKWHNIIIIIMFICSLLPTMRSAYSMK